MSKSQRWSTSSTAGSTRPKPWYNGAHLISELSLSARSRVRPQDERCVTHVLTDDLSSKHLLGRLADILRDRQALGWLGKTPVPAIADDRGDQAETVAYVVDGLL